MPEKFEVGKTYRTNLKVDAATIERFAELSGDNNPIHLDAEEARAYGYSRPVAHGALLVALLSRVIGTEVPGPGAVWMSQAIEWLAPVFEGDEIEMAVTVEKASTGAGVLLLDIVATTQEGKIVMKGNAKVKVAEKLTRPNLDSGGGKRVVLVTGGSRGIGAAIARRLGAHGVAVAVNYHKSREAAEQVVQEIETSGGSAQAFTADLGDSAATSHMIEKIIDAFGRLDIVVHGASPNILRSPVAEVGYNDIEPYLKTYLGGALTLIASASPQMVEWKFGRFIFLGTAWMLGMPPTGTTAYLAAKQALWGLVKCAATELGPSGITCNMVSPGMTVTDLTADIPSRLKELEAHKSPMRRMATTQDTAALVEFLVSDAAGYINGVNLPLTGGAS
ncbi:SDR family oxidoreductase [Chloroflexota bacterium]